MSLRTSTMADRYVHLRIFSATIVSFGLLANYGTTYSLIPTHWMDWVHLLAGPFFAVILLVILAIGHENLWTNLPAVRNLIGDESTTLNRRSAQGFGFWSMVLVGTGVYVAAPWLQMPPAKAVQLVFTLSISMAALRFGYLEQRSLNGG